VSSRAMPTGLGSGMLGTVDDENTRVEQLERELAELRAKMDGIFEAAVDGLVLINDDGIIEMFNPAAEVIFDYPAREVIGHNIGLLMPARYGLKHDGYIRHYLETGERRIIGIGRELVGRRRDGSEFPMDLSVGTVTVNDRRIFIGIIRDLSSRRAIERALDEQRERLARVGRISTLGEMASAVAHEMNQPLAAIKTYASVAGRLIGQDPPDRERLTTIFANIEQQAQRASEVIRGIRGFVQNRDVVRSTFRLEAAVESSIELFSIGWHETELAIDWDKESRGLAINGVRTQIEQVIVNLLHNAAEAAKDAGREPRILVRAYREAGQAVLEVEDNGPGVPEEVRPTLFEPFFTTKPDGTGLGLSISKSIMIGHEGDILYRPGDGGGALFEVRLPLVGETRQRVEGPR